MLIQSLNGPWQFRQAISDEWLPATVPGGVHTDLMALGRIPDPFVADNEKRVQWVAETDWDYQKKFLVNPELMAEEHVFLVCDGLDTLARVSLNGALLGKTANMFRQFRWEVKNLLHPGENILTIAFSSPVQFASERQAKRRMIGVTQAIDGGPHIRKAPCQFGWDWGPQLPPIGVWQDISLEGYTTARLEDVHLRQFHQQVSASVEATVSIEKWNSLAVQAVLKVAAPDGKTWQVETTPVENNAVLKVQIEHPELWWPNGYGRQPLYEVDVELRSGSTMLDRRHYRLGLRRLELRRQPDEWGESFTFVINDVPIFAKGSDWIPANSFPTRLTRESLSSLLLSAVQTHQNMLRIWGGGFYETDTFYDLCDEYGIMLWQDFVFACSIYPLDEPDFVDNLHLEVDQNVRRLRHHASLVLWCGNNEMEQGWESWHWDRPELQGLKSAYDQFFHHTLPEWVRSLDRDHPYWPSSPSSDTPFKDVNGETHGDAHYWDVWHGRKPFTAYRTVYPRFMSEFGFQSLPPFETVKTYASQPDWNMTSYIMEFHQRSGSGNGLMIAQMTDTFRMPKDFPSLVYLSMVLQAEGIRYGVEHWRRNRKRVSGTLYWQLNDCWPVASWASLDYFGRWKALHYAARRFYAPVMQSILDEGQRMSIHVTSDLTRSFKGSVKWTLMTLGGDVRLSGVADVSLSALESVEVFSRTFELEDEQCREMVFASELFENGERLEVNLATFAPNKHLKLVAPGLKVDVRQEGDRLVYAVTAASLARYVELQIAGADVVFSDNYFDVPGGWTINLTSPLPEGWNIERIRKTLQIRSLTDTF